MTPSKTPPLLSESTPKPLYLLPLALTSLLGSIRSGTPPGLALLFGFIYYYIKKLLFSYLTLYTSDTL